MRMEGRADFRGSRTFTIDNTGTRDIDDAIDIAEVGGDVYEVRVHIADVSYFVEGDGPLDIEARRRGESMYLVGRNIPMLPRQLSEGYCSLLPHVDRLAMTVVFRIRGDGALVKKEDGKGLWYKVFRSIIRSCTSLDYGTAQKIIDKGEARGLSEEALQGMEFSEEEWEMERRPSGGVREWQITKDLVLLNKIAQSRRKRRMCKGAGDAYDVELNFEVDERSGRSRKVWVTPQLQSMEMIEEYALLANHLASRMLLEKCRDRALLRRQLPPGETNRRMLCQKLWEMGYKDVKLTDGKEVHRFVNALRAQEQSDKRVAGIRRLLAFMNTGSESKVAKGLTHQQMVHYGVGMLHYTWFTSPIRRYHDLFVHRLMMECLDPYTPVRINTRELEVWADQLTHRSKKLKRAEDRCDCVYLMDYFMGQEEQRGQPMCLEAFVFRCNPKEVKVLLTDYDVDCVLGLDKFQGYIFEDNSVKVSPHGAREMLTLRVGDIVNVQLAFTNSPRELRAILLSRKEIAQTQLVLEADDEAEGGGGSKYGKEGAGEADRTEEGEHQEEDLDGDDIILILPEKELL